MKLLQDKLNIETDEKAVSDTLRIIQNSEEKNLGRNYLSFYPELQVHKIDQEIIEKSNWNKGKC